MQRTRRGSIAQRSASIPCSRAASGLLEAGSVKLGGLLRISVACLTEEVYARCMRSFLLQVGKPRMTETAPLQSEHVTLPWWRRYTRWTQTSYAEAQAAERALLACCRTDLEIRNIPVGTGKDQTMHTIIAGDEANPPLVLLPGYGAAAGFYFRNVDGLAQQFRVYLVDFLGTGLSGRPPWKAKSREEAETFFLDALKKWQKEVGLKKMILVGHSLGGYLAASYSLRYPDDVQHLVLVCPAGMSTPPTTPTVPKWATDRWTWRHQLYKAGLYLWDAGATPGAFLRGVGPYGPKMVNGYARNRFREGVGLTEDETVAFGDYIYHTSAQRGSGEYALRHILGPFAHARHPLEGRLHDLKVPCSLIYGQSDWMKPENGKRVFADMEERRGKLDEADLQLDVIPNAGHYPFLDQPAVFLQRMLRQTQLYLRGQGQAAADLSRKCLQEADRAAEQALEEAQRLENAQRSFDL